jgi:hypothetical protein
VLLALDAQVEEIRLVVVLSFVVCTVPYNPSKCSFVYLRDVCGVSREPSIHPAGFIPPPFSPVYFLFFFSCSYFDCNVNEEDEPGGRRSGKAE